MKRAGRKSTMKFFQQFDVSNLLVDMHQSVERCQFDLDIEERHNVWYSVVFN